MGGDTARKKSSQLVACGSRPLLSHKLFTLTPRAARHSTSQQMADNNNNVRPTHMQARRTRSRTHIYTHTRACAWLKKKLGQRPPSAAFSIWSVKGRDEARLGAGSKHRGWCEPWRWLRLK